MQVPTFFVESSDIVKDKISDILGIDSSCENSDDFFYDLKYALEDLASTNKSARAFLRFIRCQEERMQSAIINDESPEGQLLFLTSCHYYYGF